LTELGFQPIDGWNSCFVHDKWQLYLTVYVDDFKMAGPNEHFAKAWKMIGTKIKLDPPVAMNKYLGCHHAVTEEMWDLNDHPLAELFAKGDLPLGSAQPGKQKVACVEYDMSDFLRQCVDKYVELAGDRTKPLKPAQTPFLEENTGSPCGQEPREGEPSLECEGKPSLNKKEKPKGQSPTGVLADIAVRVLMKVFYAARIA
ncbi:MAG: hypothetical protein GY780_14465, partial [bacterium]|nr:hypothetical protein [bacterium]